MLVIGLIITVDQYFEIFDKINFGEIGFLPSILNGIFSLTIITTILLVIFENGKPTKTIAWILILLFIPLVGILLYLYFGRNYRKTKIFSRKGLMDRKEIDDMNVSQIHDLHERNIEKDPYIMSKGQIMKLLLRNSKALLTENNHAEILNNGKATFEAVLTNLRAARNHIHLEYYILEDDKIGNTIKDILIDKAKNGVHVRVIYDEVGSWSLGKKFLSDLRLAGVEVFAFLPIRFPLFANKINYRNHRKIIIVDGLVGFVGGINIADRYIDGDPDLGFWRDTHLKIEGDAVHGLQSVFLTDWYFVTRQMVNDSAYFPEHTITTRQWMQITSSGPDSDWASIMQAYFMAITTAKHYIYISTPYFMPNESILTALKTASLSGVKVVINLPGISDFFLYTWTTKSYLPELIDAGIEIYIYKKGFTHSKLIMVDGEFSSVGTANMDMRSFDQNFEVNALIYDRAITEQLENAFHEDLDASFKLSKKDMASRSVIRKFRESLARIFTPLL